MYATANKKMLNMLILDILEEYSDANHILRMQDLIAKMNFSEEHLQKIRDKGVVILADYWKPNDCYEFDVSIESENIDYKFF